ncbi:MAG TPA: hypothetical protein VHL98_23480 [Microvirga sp.]|jgi:hypothetical protein|nr:hypothetical protein [Microvirga sp.]
MADPTSAGVRFRLEVATARADVAAFADALGLVEPGEIPDDVPLTYPIRWLADGAVRDWLVGVLGGEGLPVHEMQDFTYFAPLALDRTYALDVTCDVQEGDPPRVTIAAEIRDGDGVIGSARSSILKIRLGAA